MLNYVLCYERTVSEVNRQVEKQTTEIDPDLRQKLHSQALIYYIIVSELHRPIST